MDRNLDGIYFRVQRDEKWGNACFSDLTQEEMERVMENRDVDWLKSMCIQLGKTIRRIGDELDIVCEQYERMRNMDKITGLMELLGEDNNKKIKDKVTQFIIDAIEDDIHDYNRDSYILNPEEIIDFVNECKEEAEKYCVDVNTKEVSGEF